MDLTTRVVGPRQCALVVAIPVTRDVFMRDLDAAAGKDFVRSYAKGFAGLAPDSVWRRYQRYAELVDDVAREAELLGVAVTRAATLADIRTALVAREIVTLVAHWLAEGDTDGRVELDDGLHSVEAVAGQVPPSFVGVIDLTVCRSTVLGEAIKRRHRDCLVVMNRSNAKLDYRLILYRHVVRELHRRPASFVDVVTRLHVAQLNGG